MSEERQYNLKTDRVFEPFPETEENEETFDFVELIYRLLGKWKFILSLALILAVLFGVYSSFFVTPMYQATSIIYILNRKDSTINMSDLQMGSALAKDYMKVFSIWEVHEEVASNLGLSLTTQEMQNMVSVANEDGTRMMNISVIATEPGLAADMANEYASVVSHYIADVMVTEEPTIVSTAREPEMPFNINVYTSVAIGLILGFVIAAAIVVIQFFADDKYKSAEEIRKYTGLPNLAIVPINNAGEPRKKEKRARE